MAEAVVQLDAAQAGEISRSESSSSAHDNEVDTISDLDLKLLAQCRAQFENISCEIVETGKNLSCFEDMLGPNRQVAKIRPLGTTDEENAEKDERTGEGAAVLSQTQLALTGKLENLLADLSEAVYKVAALKENTPLGTSAEGDEVKRLREENTRLRERNAALEERCSTLEKKASTLQEDLAGKTSTCNQMAESAHRARAALNEERERSDRLDERLERERRAAAKVGEDITRYVAQMRSLEAEVERLKRERNALKKATAKSRAAAPDSGPLPVELAMEGELLTATMHVTGGQTEEVRRLITLNESANTPVKRLEAKVKRMAEQELEYQNQLEELKDGLTTLQSELEDKVASSSLLVAAGKGGEVNVEALESDLKNLRAKSKSLLSKYRKKKTALTEQERRIERAKSLLTDVMLSCAVTERNYRLALAHLGTEIETSARLMAAYLGVAKDLPRAPAQLAGRAATDWLSDVQSLSDWLQGQIVLLGKRVWTGKESPPQPATLPAPKASKCGPSDAAGEALRAQEEVVRDRRRAFESLLSEALK